MRIYQRKWMLEVIRATAVKMTPAERTEYILRTWDKTLALLAR